MKNTFQTKGNLLDFYKKNKQIIIIWLNQNSYKKKLLIIKYYFSDF